MFVETPPAPAGLNAAVRSLFGRLSAEPAPEPVAAVAPRKRRRSGRPAAATGRRSASSTSTPASTPSASPRRGRARRLPHRRRPRAVGRSTPRSASSRRRSPGCGGPCSTYGEALKAIEVYGADPEVRKAAADALRRAPERLRTAAPVPHEPKARRSPWLTSRCIRRRDTSRRPSPPGLGAPRGDHRAALAARRADVGGAGAPRRSCSSRPWSRSSTRRSHEGVGGGSGDTRSPQRRACRRSG